MRSRIFCAVLFARLDWSDPKKINLRSGKLARAREDDGPGIGDTYFRCQELSMARYGDGYNLKIITRSSS